MKFKPLGDRALLAVIEAKETQGSIYIPENAREKSNEAIVLAVGAGRVLENGETVPVPVNVGDRIIVNLFRAKEIKINGETFHTIMSGEILGVLDDEV